MGTANRKGALVTTPAEFYETHRELLDRAIEAAAARGIPFVLARQESAAVIMAATEAELTGRPGAVVVTRGPGVGNAANISLQIRKIGRENRGSYFYHFKFSF